MNKRHYYTLEETDKAITVYRFDNVGARDWQCTQYNQKAKYAGSTNRFVVRAIKLFKLGQEWPIDVRKD